MTESILNDRKGLIEYYKVQADDLRMRHSAILTEVRHYTWLLSILLGAGPIAAVKESSLTNNQIGFLLFLPILGVYVAVIAFLIIRRDFKYYTTADSRLLYLEKELGVTEHAGFVEPRLHRALSDDFSVERDIKMQEKIGIRSLMKLRIRALILMSFIVYAIAGVGEVLFFLCLMTG